MTNAQEPSEMASWNHGWVQMQLCKTFLLDVPNYVPNLELSLDISKFNLSQFNFSAKEELKPDICLYPPTRRGLSKPKDIVRMSEIPLLAIEILSPRQGLLDIKENFEVYFFLGIKSCWMVLPEIETVTVYSSMNQCKTFSRPHADSKVIDEVLDLQLPLNKIFD
jgi:Uma2 family endonuclease